MTTDGGSDPYSAFITLRDVNEFLRGWDASNSVVQLQVSREKAAAVIPSTSGSVMPFASQTLTRHQSETAQVLPDGVVLRISGNAILSAALKFTSAFVSPIPWSVERGALVCALHKATPNMELQVTIAYTDVNGEVSSQITPGADYSMKPPSSSAASKSTQRFEFKNDGKIELHTAASTTIISAPLLPSNKHESKEKVRQILAHPVIASVMVRAVSLKTVFPPKRVKSEQDRTINISSAGIEITGIVEENPVSVNFQYGKGDCSDYNFITPPTRNLTAKLAMVGLSQIGQCIASGTATGVELTFYEKTNETYYMCVRVMFSQLSSGSAFLSILEVRGSETSRPAAAASLSALKDLGDQPLVPQTEVPRHAPSVFVPGVLATARPTLPPQPLLDEEEEEEEEDDDDDGTSAPTATTAPGIPFDDGDDDDDDFEELR
ncbi:MAG: hypothetical protein WC483_02200 [Candidatus Paceibacterota bacterium]